MKKILLILFTYLLLSSVSNSFSQNPNPALIGYWQNWNDFQCPYIPLTQIDSSYNIILVAFAVPQSGTSYNMTFTPEGVSQLTLQKQIDTMHMKSKKIIISIGGANHPVSLNDTNQRNVFISSMMNIITSYNFDGMDIDLEGSSLSISGGTISNPVDAKIINLIYAVRKIMDLYRAQYNKKMILTMAPETAFVQGGMSAYAGIWGAYLPVIDALRDSIDVLQVQLYNSGSMYGIDGNIYYQGTVDFIVSQTEAVIQGFSTSGGYFNGLRQDQIVVGLPACQNAAGGGYLVPDSVKAAILYLQGFAPKPANYTKVSSYPDLRGMMDWSINWDKVSTCGGVYEYANNFNSIFRPSQMLNLNAIIQGFYIPAADTMRRDTVRVILRDTVSPYENIDSSIAYMETDGSATCMFTNAQNNKRYYIQIKHRNSLETWSKAGGEIFNSMVLNFSFKTSASQAFGSNMISVNDFPVRYAVYSGDVNQDGNIDLTDIVLIQNSASVFNTGYVNSDLNGDLITDLSDILIALNNAAGFIVKVVP